jgi:holin-like protein
MEIIKQLGLIIGFGYAGELLAQILPFRLPAGVLGIVLVFTVLSLGVLRPRHFGKTADFISAHMAFFFLPLAVSVLQNYQTISPVLFQVLAVCLISTLITFTVSYAAVRLLRSIAGKGGSPASLARLPPASTKTPDSAEAEFALHANSVSKKPVRGFCSGTPLGGGTAGPAAAPATPPDSAVDLTHNGAALRTSLPHRGQT